jgi:hypothetical protein
MGKAKAMTASGYGVFDPNKGERIIVLKWAFETKV